MHESKGGLEDIILVRSNQNQRTTPVRSGLGSTQARFDLDMCPNRSMPRIRCTHGLHLVDGAGLD